MKLLKLSIALLLFASGMIGATHVNGKLVNADGTNQSGYVLVSWKTSITSESKVVGAAEKRFAVVDGVLDLTLEPGQYSVRYYVGTGRIEYWLVPTSSETVNLSALITLTIPTPSLMVAPSQISPGGATIGQLLLFNGFNWLPADVSGGLRGPAGAGGLKGDIGLQGMQGVPGQTGAQGSAGGNGSRGDTGAQGIQGIQGIQGEPGTGTGGGTQGPQGIQGVKGDPGSTGLTGGTGPTGSTGSLGVIGLTGPQGVKGDKGDTGMVGSQGLIGLTGPGGTTGSQGILGTTGSPGVKGDPGQAGTPGTAGSTGSQGIQGVQGIPGSSGSTGAAGADGVTGSKGNTGDSGTTGSQGNPGIPGDRGAAGSAGSTGAQGIQGVPGVTGATGAPGSGVDLTGDVTSVAGVTTIADSVVTASKLYPSNNLRTVCFVFGSDNAASVLADADLLQKRQFMVNTPSTIVDFSVTADAGTPSIQVSKLHWGITSTSLLSSPLSTAAGGALACSNTTGGAGISSSSTDTCTATLSVTSLMPGDWIEFTTGGAAGGTAKRMSACLTWTVN